jgi:hypothetical protein
MAELIVVEKDGGRMNAPPAKLQEYLEAGWKEAARAPMTGDAAPAKNKPTGKGKQDAAPEAEE